MRMLSEKRRNEVLSAISRIDGVSVSALAKTFGVSMETIRKDIRFWEEKGILRKTHGGAILHDNDRLSHINKRSVENVGAKNAIAAKLLEYIPRASTVFVDSGSTAVCAAKQLAFHTGLTIVTHSVLVASELAESGNKVMLLGGILHPESMGSHGLWAANALKSILIDVAVIDSSGFKGFDGPVVNDFADAEVKGMVVQRSKLKVVIADSSKFSTSGLVQYCRWGDVDILITDSGADPERCEELRKTTEVVFA
jgi:Transcriptional regulators of sugar metabolism